MYHNYHSHLVIKNFYIECYLNFFVKVIDIVNEKEAVVEAPESRKECNKLQSIDSTCRRSCKRLKMDSEFRIPLAGDNDTTLLVMPHPDYAHQVTAHIMKLWHIYAA